MRDSGSVVEPHLGLEATGTCHITVAVSKIKKTSGLSWHVEGKGGPRIFYMTVSTVGGNREGRLSFKLNFLHLGK